MTDPTTPNHDQPVEGSRSESYTAPDAGNLGGSSGSFDADTGAAAKANDVLESLRETVEDLAERATPLLREFSAKAAEILASAADKAAPLAQKAGEATADASGKLAEKSRTWAAGTRESLAGNHPVDTTDAFDTSKTDPPTTI
jgi:hypothetical protein